MYHQAQFSLHPDYTPLATRRPQCAAAPPPPPIPWLHPSLDGYPSPQASPLLPAPAAPPVFIWRLSAANGYRPSSRGVSRRSTGGAGSVCRTDGGSAAVSIGLVASNEVGFDHGKTEAAVFRRLKTPPTATANVGANTIRTSIRSVPVTLLLPQAYSVRFARTATGSTITLRFLHPYYRYDIFPSVLAILRFFFRLIVLAFSLSRLWRRTFYPFFPSTVRAVAARCKLPLPPAQTCPKKMKCAPRKSHRKGKDRTRVRDRGKETKEKATRPLSPRLRMP